MVPEALRWRWVEVHAGHNTLAFEHQVPVCTSVAFGLCSVDIRIKFCFYFCVELCSFSSQFHSSLAQALFTSTMSQFVAQVAAQHKLE